MFYSGVSQKSKKRKNKENHAPKITNYFRPKVSNNGISQEAGQPAVVSDQGTMTTCSSHAISKAIVELLDIENYNCKQEEIQASLQNKIQPNGM